MTVEHHEISSDRADDAGTAQSSQPNDAPNSNLGDEKAIFPEVALVRVAQAIRDLRKLRQEQLALAEPAWDMIIELYYRDSTGESTTTAQLRQVSNVPFSTADRWLEHLRQDEWIRIKPHPTDPHTRFVDLSRKAREAMNRYLTEVRSFALKQPTG